MEGVTAGDVIGLGVVLISFALGIKYSIRAIKNRFYNPDDALRCLTAAMVANVGSIIIVLL